MRPCAEPGCPTLVERGTRGGRCPEHRREVERLRGSRQKRGYGLAHTALRARWARKVALGVVECWRCGERLNPLEPWDLGHLDDRSGYGGPECLPCNRSTAAR